MQAKIPVLYCSSPDGKIAPVGRRTKVRRRRGDNAASVAQKQCRLKSLLWRRFALVATTRLAINHLFFVFFQFGNINGSSADVGGRASRACGWLQQRVPVPERTAKWSHHLKHRSPPSGMMNLSHSLSPLNCCPDARCTGYDLWAGSGIGGRRSIARLKTPVLVENSAAVFNRVRMPLKEASARGEWAKPVCVARMPTILMLSDEAAKIWKKWRPGADRKRTNSLLPGEQIIRRRSRIL